MIEGPKLSAGLISEGIRLPAESGPAVNNIDRWHLCGRSWVRDPSFDLIRASRGGAKRLDEGFIIDEEQQPCLPSVCMEILELTLRAWAIG